MDVFDSHLQSILTALNPKNDSNPLLLCLNLTHSKHQLELLTQLIFELHDFSHFYAQLGSILALYSSGKTTAMVLDLGGAQTSFLPVYEGSA